MPKGVYSVQRMWHIMSEWIGELEISGGGETWEWRALWIEAWRKGRKGRATTTNLLHLKRSSSYFRHRRTRHSFLKFVSIRDSELIPPACHCSNVCEP